MYLLSKSLVFLAAGDSHWVVFALLQSLVCVGHLAHLDLSLLPAHPNHLVCPCCLPDRWPNPHPCCPTNRGRRPSRVSLSTCAAMAA